MFVTISDTGQVRFTLKAKTFFTHNILVKWEGEKMGELPCKLFLVPLFPQQAMIEKKRGHFVTTADKRTWAQVLTLIGYNYKQLGKQRYQVEVGDKKIPFIVFRD